MAMRRIMLLLLVALSVLASVGSIQARTTMTSGTVHIVQPGQTLFSIARWYGVDLWVLARANQIVNPNHIYVGQRLVIPVSQTVAQPAGGTYVVKPGDTLYSIARYYGVTAWSIAQANGIYNMNHIFVGQHLLIPGLAPAPRPQTGSSSSTSWRGEYYAGTELAGGPLFARDDRAVNFHWGLESPDTRLNTDQFSVHWTRTINFRGGLYRFAVTVDDGVRLWVDGNLVLDEWHVQPEITYEVDLTLSPGNHLIAIDYFDDTGIATIQFTFKRLGSAPTDTGTPTPTPSSTPDPSVSTGGWLGQYYGNAHLQGTPVITRTDTYIGFDWGQGSPVGGIPENFFSVRWTQHATFYEDNYVFCAKADDGVRLYLDATALIDEWHGSAGYTNYCVEADIIKGTHKVEVEYYEDGGEASIYVWWERR